jgi:hypothetical protein
MTSGFMRFRSSDSTFSGVPWHYEDIGRGLASMVVRMAEDLTIDIGVSYTG